MCGTPSGLKLKEESLKSAREMTVWSQTDWTNIYIHWTHLFKNLFLSPASFLLYCLLDVLIDSCFPIVRYIGNRLEQIEFKMLDKPSSQLNKFIYSINRELLILQHHVAPMKDVIENLMSVADLKTPLMRWIEPEEDEGEGETTEAEDEALFHDKSAKRKPRRSKKPLVSNITKRYLDDVAKNIVQLYHMIDTYSTMCTNVRGLYTDHQSQRMNRIMFILTVVSTIFIPITFVAGVVSVHTPSFHLQNFCLWFLFFFLLFVPSLFVKLLIFIVCWSMLLKFFFSTGWTLNTCLSCLGNGATLWCGPLLASLWPQKSCSCGRLACSSKWCQAPTDQQANWTLNYFKLQFYTKKKNIRNNKKRSSCFLKN